MTLACEANEKPVDAGHARILAGVHEDEGDEQDTDDEMGGDEDGDERVVHLDSPLDFGSRDAEYAYEHSIVASLGPGHNAASRGNPVTRRAPAARRRSSRRAARGRAAAGRSARRRRAARRRARGRRRSWRRTAPGWCCGRCSGSASGSSMASALPWSAVTRQTPPRAATAVDDPPRQASTVSTAATAAAITPVWPTMSALAKLMMTKSNAPASSWRHERVGDLGGAHLRLVVVGRARRAGWARGRASRPGTPARRRR